MHNNIKFVEMPHVVSTSSTTAEYEKAGVAGGD